MSRNKVLRLNNLVNIKRSIASVTRAYYRNEQGEEINGYWFRTLATLLDLLLKAHQQEKLSEFDERISRIESFIEDFRYDKKQA